MLSLAEFQHNIAADILDGGTRTLDMLPGDGAAARIALGVHRNTVLAALVNALRMTYPTVDRLVGTQFFDQAALAYARANPPRGMSLSDYGDGFADFLAGHEPAQGLACLADLARFDLFVERSANMPRDLYRLALMLDGDVALELAGSLTCLQIQYPADLVRDALESGGDDPLAGIDLAPRPCSFAFWRGPRGASVKSLSAPAAAFLGAVLQGSGSAAALDTAMALASREEALAAIQGEIFTASFARITTPRSQE